MPPAEVWWLIEAKMPRPQGREQEAAELVEFMQEQGAWRVVDGRLEVNPEGSKHG